MKKSSLPTALVTVLAPVAWGTTYVTITELLPAGRPLFVAAMRVLPAGLLLVVVGWLRHRWRPRGVAAWRRSAVLAATNFAVFFPLLIVGAYRLPGGVAAAMGGLQPILVAVLGGAADRRAPRVRDLAVGTVAAAGVAMIVLRPGAAFDLVGVLAAALANVSFALGVVITKRTAPPDDRIAATGWQLLLGGIVLLPLSLVAEGAPPAVDGVGALGFAYLSLLGTGVAFVLWFRGIERLPAAAPPLLGLAAPLTGAALGWLLLSESLSALQIAGFVTTFAAIVYGATLDAAPRRVPGRSTPQPLPCGAAVT